jgi:excisionase family DNA binding protein
MSIPSELLQSTAAIPDVAHDGEHTEAAVVPVERSAKHLPPRNDRRPRQRFTKTHRARGPPPTPMTPLAVSVSEAARLIGICRAMLYVLIKDGQLQIVKIGRRSLITTDEIKRFLAARAAESAAA